MSSESIGSEISTVFKKPSESRLGMPPKRTMKRPAGKASCRRTPMSENGMTPRSLPSATSSMRDVNDTVTPGPVNWTPFKYMMCPDCNRCFLRIGDTMIASHRCSCGKLLPWQDLRSPTDSQVFTPVLMQCRICFAVATNEADGRDFASESMCRQCFEGASPQ